jgi:hypothetical protein
MALHSGEQLCIRLFEDLLSKKKSLLPAKDTKIQVLISLAFVAKVLWKKV